jgi:hypothetical protein
MSLRSSPRAARTLALASLSTVATLAGGALCPGSAEAAALAFRNVGRVVGATTITACSDGRLYVLSGDGSLRVNRTPTAGGAFERLGAVVNPGDLFCHDNTLHHLDSLGTVRKAVDRAALSMPNTVVVLPGLADAREVESGSVVALIVPVPVSYKVQRGTNVLSSSGNLNGWTQRGQPGGAAHIAVGGGFLESRIYALNGDGSFWANAGTGCNEYWWTLGSLPNADTITASQQNRVFALNRDDTIQQIDITPERRALSVNSAQFGLGVAAALGGSGIRVDSPLGRFTPSARLAANGVPAQNFAVPRQHRDIAGIGVDIDLEDLNLNRFTGRLSAATAILRLEFETTGIEVVTFGLIHPWYDIRTPNGELHFQTITGQCAMPEFDLTNATFEGTLAATDVGGSLLDPFLPDIRTIGENSLIGAGDAIFGQRTTQVGLQRALLQTADTLTGLPLNTWRTLVPGTVSLRGGVLNMTVER